MTEKEKAEKLYEEMTKLLINSKLMSTSDLAILLMLSVQTCLILKVHKDSFIETCSSTWDAHHRVIKERNNDR